MNAWQKLCMWRRIGIWFVLPIMASACSNAAPADSGALSCDSTALGVERTINVTAQTGPIEVLLSDGEVVLTFDDGPDPRRTRTVLDLLDKHCTKATFFLLGREAKRYPDIVREIAARGHSLGGHSFTHADLTTLELEAAVDEVSTGVDTVNAALVDTGPATIMFRFPFVATTEQLSAEIRRMGLLEVGVTVDGADWTNIQPDASVEMIFEKLQATGGKGIILLHDPFYRSDERVSLLLSRLKQDGYKVVALRTGETGQ